MRRQGRFTSGRNRPGGSGRRRWRLGLGLVAVLVLLGVGLSVPGGEATRGCSGARVTGWRPEGRMTAELARYGNDNARHDDWTGGDGTRSVRLPDGRTLWLFADTFLDQVFDAGGHHSRRPDPVWVRNAALVMSEDGRFERTLLGGTESRPAALFGGTATSDGREVWRWPVQAVVERRRPGAPEKVVRVLLWQREAGSAPWIFGVPRATEVATFSLPGLRLESITTLDRPRHTDPERRVLYGTSALTRGRWTYVFGADEGSVEGKASRAHVARVPRGELDDPEAWRYWSGSPGAGPSGGGWRSDPAGSEPILVGRTAQRGATGTYTVARHGAGWLLLTMDAGAPDGGGITDVVSYWACSPTGPWRGPHRVAKPPLPEGAGRLGAVPYNPQAHPEFSGPGEGGGGDGLLLSYDVNVLGTDTGAIQRNVALYRPRFLRLDIGPAEAP
ncbi:DUF4185 domain-containing protein [Streptomyces diacarni]|uniref:DUF4185 domain-containing protein n=1 Tax=Streptomyces diacarni TaxID=2800381 RepID=A0A367F6K6_9ACTN|nr:DUF4185 domain-containing protein [Streptomyces diacarni]RCG25994.1 DUF4185 domain-containing protein [Streptomyces diacarni]